MDKVNGFANQISELYKRASDDFCVIVLFGMK